MTDDTYSAAVHDVVTYQCGLTAGDALILKRDLEVRDHRGRRTGRLRKRGEVWRVEKGSSLEPEVVWLIEPDGARHTWPASEIFESFDRVF